MARALGRAAAALGWAALSLAALLGVGLATAAFLAAAPFSRPFVARHVVAYLDAAIAGHVTLKGIQVLPHGGIELVGLEVSDPEGELVLSVGRARASVDLTGLARRAVGVALELERPSVMVAEERGGGTSLARAFAPAHPGPARQGEGGRGSPWTVFVSRLTIQDGDLWWVDADGATRVEASAIELSARGIRAPDRARAELEVAGALAEPVEAPFSVEVAAGTNGTAVRVPVLRAKLGGTTLALAGEGDLARRSGRLALLRVDVARGLARELAPRVPAGADLDAAGYAESDGATVTAALRVEPVGPGAAGRVDAGVALRLDAAARALGFDVALDRVDPARLAAELPRGEITLAAHGAAAGRSLRDLRGRIEAHLDRSRLRGGEVRSAEVVGRADRGTFEVSRGSVVAPGVSAEVAGRWREGGAVAGKATASATDLALAARNVAALLGRPPAAIGGRGRLDATLGGTSDAPTAAGTLDAAELRVGGIALAGARLAVEAAGPLRAASLRVDGRIAAVRSRAAEVARAVALRAALAGGTASVDASASLPGFDEPARIEGRGRLTPARDAIEVSTLALSYPGTRWTLAAPATVTLAGPSVDRLELAEGPQRIAIAGGVAGKELDARVQLVRVDLARLPAGVLAPEGGLKGELSADATARGPLARPELAAAFTLAGGGFQRVTGVSAMGTATWSGAARRVAGSAALTRGGATLDVAGDLPLPVAGRAAERVRLSARAGGVPVADLLAATGSEADAAGVLSFDAALDGTVGAPALRAHAALEDARWRELDGFALEVSADDAGDRAVVSVRVAHDGSAVATARAEAPLRVADLLARPRDTARALRTAPLAGTAAVTGLPLAALSGRAGVPAGIAGRVDGAATLSGSLAHPRAQATLELADAAFAGYRDVAAHAAIALSATSISVTGRAAVARDEVVRFGVTLDVPVERLGAVAAVRAARLRGEVVVPQVALERTGPRDVPLAGRVSARLTLAGTAGAPEATLVAEGEDVAIMGRPLGRARLDGSYARARAAATVVLTPRTGGTLKATGAVTADLGVGATRPPLAEAPAEATLVADRLDLAVVAALVPKQVRSSAGLLDADLSARGPLARLTPRGTLRVRDGRVAVAEYGEYGGIAVDAAASEDALELSRLEVRRGKGKLAASASVRGLRSRSARVEAHLESSAFTVARAGMDLATVDVRADATGAWDGANLTADVNVPHGLVRLPSRSPRPLQPLDRRKDISIGRPQARRASARGPAEPRYSAVIHVVVPRQLFVKSDNPKLDVELKADVTYEWSGGEDYVRGYVEAVRGTVEPIAGRTFTLERARVQFTGGPPSAATLDVEARYENPAAVVTAKILGPLSKPDIKLTSQPPMDEGQIALLIATGQTDLKAGTGAVGTLTGADAGKAALGALTTKLFRDVIANKLPIDTLAVDSGAIRAGTYFTPRIYIGYTRRFEANPARGENPDEVRVEYQISPHWSFESRYGTAQSGGASLIWSKDF